MQETNRLFLITRYKSKNVFVFSSFYDPLLLQYDLFYFSVLNSNNSSSHVQSLTAYFLYFIENLYINFIILLFKVYMTDFFLFARLNLPNVLIGVAKKIFHSDFPFPCFNVPKVSNFTSGGVQNRDTKNRTLGTIVTSIQDSKPREKQISQSFSYCELINLLRNGSIVRCL